MNTPRARNSHAFPRHWVRLGFAARLLLTVPAVAVGSQFITQQPVSVTVDRGQAATFRVEARIIDHGPYGDTYREPNYQWFKDNSKIKDATSSKLTLTNVQPADAASYGVIVFDDNDRGYEISRLVTLTVVIPVAPAITGQPISVALFAGQTANFDVFATGTPAPAYQWRRGGFAIPGATASRFFLHDIQDTDAGSYDVVVSNKVGSVTSRPAMLTLLTGTPTAAPSAALLVASKVTSIRMQPESNLVSPGQATRFQVAAVGENLTYQWKKNGAFIAGATSPAHFIAGATPADMGFYSVVVTGTDRAIESDTVTLAVAAGSGSRLANLSIRGVVPPGGTLTPGFTLRGAGTKQLLVRAIGPGLARFGVANAARNPRLELIRAGATTALLANDNWTNNASRAALLTATAAVGAFALDENSKDAALLASLNSASYDNFSVRIASDETDSPGVVLAEIYDADSPDSSVRLAAASTLGFAGAGASALVCGFTISGLAPKHVVIRAIGPGLAPFGVNGLLQDPQLTVTALGCNATVAANDNWDFDAALITAFSAAGAFPLAADSKDAAVVLYLPPGGYTVTVSGVGHTSGNALVEIYDLDP